MLSRLKQWFRDRRSEPTREELLAGEEGGRLLEDKETYRTLDRSGPRDFTPGSRRDTGRS